MVASALNIEVISNYTSFSSAIRSMDAVSVKKIDYPHKHEDLLTTTQLFLGRKC